MVNLFGIEADPMEKVVGRRAFSGMVRLRRIHRSPGLWLVLVWLLTACFGGGAQEGLPAEPPLGQVVLACSETCAQYGQCGTAADGRYLILGHSERPETQNHNLAFPVDLPISIQAGNEQRIQPPGSDSFVQGFSLITLHDNGKAGWVANWCIAAAPAQ